MIGRVFKRILPVLGLALFIAALWVLHHELKQYHFRDMRAFLRQLPALRVFAAIGCAALGYLALTGYDALALRYAGRSLPYPQVALASFVGYAFSHNMGQSALSGGSVRLRLYSAWGVPPGDIAKVIAFCVTTSLVGLCAVSGALFLLSPFPLPPASYLQHVPLCPLGMVLLAFPLGLLALTFGRQAKAPGRSRWRAALPPLRLALPLLVCTAVDWTMVGSTLIALLPPAPGFSFVHLLGVFMLAEIIGLASQVPGGLGVFETVFILLLQGAIPSTAVLGALVVFRGIYYLCPLIVAALLLGGHEAVTRKETIRKYGAYAVRWSHVVTPRALALAIFLSGAVLLVSGAAPAIHSRLGFMERFFPVPLTVVEVSHFLSSMVGAALLVLANGIHRRVDAAYFLTVLLLAAGTAFTLLKGLAYEEAIVLALMLVALLPCRRHFTRKASLFYERFTPQWWTAVALVLFCAFWVAAFSTKNVAYRSELWSRFVLREDAPRILRAFAGAAVVFLFAGLAQLLRPAFPKPQPLDGRDWDRVKAVVERSKRSSAWLALLGDKNFLFSETGEAFLMYAVQGRSWIVMGDPVGPEEEWDDLLWRFREVCDHNGGRPVFYQVSEDRLSYYVDLGLSLHKLGEEGRVALEGFSLEGGARKNIRSARNKLLREGCSLEIVPAAQAAQYLPALREISDAWLAEKRTREKGFSLGQFDEDYLRQCPLAIVRRQETPVAFANLWLGADKEELSPDLMRYRPSRPDGSDTSDESDAHAAPDNVMEYLFIELMLWGAKEGYRWFSLGMAPLAGLENRPLAPLWSRVGAIIFRHGENFYNFQGLRQYKEKLGPVWEGRYLAAPGGLAFPAVLLDVASLIGGGLAGVVAK